MFAISNTTNNAYSLLCSLSTNMHYMRLSVTTYIFLLAGLQRNENLQQVTEVFNVFSTMYYLTSSIQFPKAMKANEHTTMAAIAPALSPLGPPPPETRQKRNI